MSLIDAHNHLHDARLAPHLPAILPELSRLGLRHAVVNGTRESDWDAVATLAVEHSWIVPSYGLHPWHVADRGENWLDDLRRRLEENPRAAVGEIGLDRWIEGHDLAVQLPVFTAQLALAAELDRPATIHCIRAWGALESALKSTPLPRCGFLLHAYAGPAEMVPSFANLGAYFSFNPYFLHERKAAQRETFRQIPPERLLVETDAPDMPPPPERNPRPLADDIHHPANIDMAYSALAEIRRVSIESIKSIVAENFTRLFIH